MARRDQRQTLYCHITGPCCILNSTNLSKQSDKILRWRDVLATSPLPPLLALSLVLSRSPPLCSLLRFFSLLSSKISSGNKQCERREDSARKHRSTKGKKKKKTTSTTTCQGLDRCWKKKKLKTGAGKIKISYRSCCRHTDLLRIAFLWSLRQERVCCLCRKRVGGR